MDSARPDLDRDAWRQRTAPRIKFKPDGSLDVS